MSLFHIRLDAAAIGICLVLNVVLGTLWYQPFLFGRMYSELTGQPVDGPPNPKKLGTAVVCSLMTVLALAVLLSALGITAIPEALALSLLISIGFVVAVNLPIYLYDGHPLRLFMINSGLTVTGLMLNAVLLVLIKFRS